MKTTPFGARLRELREKEGMTQAELAEKIRVSKSSINMYERGEREPGFETLEALADLFNISFDSLLGKREQELFYYGSMVESAESAYRYFSLGYNFSPIERNLISAFSTLNKEGQQKAVERVQELTEIPRYLQNEDD